MKIFNLRNDTNSTISFIPYRETFQVNVKPNDLLKISTLTDEEWLYYDMVSRQFVTPTDATFYASFLNGNRSVFKGYGTIIDNEDGTISVIGDINNSGPNTYFNSNKKNIDWSKDGIIVKCNIVIDSTSMSNNEYFNITNAVNGNYDGNISFIGERSIYFRKYSEGVKVGYEWNGSSDEINKTATSNSSSILLTDGNYTITFYTHKKSTSNTVVMDIAVINEEDSIVFSVKDCILGNDDGVVSTSNIAGVRYLWFSSMNVNNGVKINDLSLIRK